MTSEPWAACQSYTGNQVKGAAGDGASKTRCDFRNPNRTPA